MSRVIKFRAWDKESKRFVKNVLEHIIPTVNTREGFRLKSYFILEQFAGFKDKNDNPVYEGDILQWSYGHGDKSIFTGKVIFGHYSVGDNSWSMELYTVGFFIQFSDGGVCGIEDNKNRYKKIGNIHQNTNLL